jgi:hypothetical protein
MFLLSVMPFANIVSMHVAAFAPSMPIRQLDRSQKKEAWPPSLRSTATIWVSTRPPMKYGQYQGVCLKKHNHNMKEARVALESSTASYEGSTATAVRTHNPIGQKQNNYRKEAYSHQSPRGIIIVPRWRNRNRDATFCFMEANTVQRVCDSSRAAACIEAWCWCRKQVNTSHCWPL